MSLEFNRSLSLDEQKTADASLAFQQVAYAYNGDFDHNRHQAKNDEVGGCHFSNIMTRGHLQGQGRALVRNTGDGHWEYCK